MTTPQPQQPAGGNVVPKTNHTYVLIDRSGSMESIASDVIGDRKSTRLNSSHT